jgi:hypothetical protein
VRRPQAPPREANQGVWSFILLNGLLGHEKATDQAVSLRHDEVLVCSSDDHLWCHGSSSRDPFIGEGHGRDDGLAFHNTQSDERANSLWPWQFCLAAASQKVGDRQDLALRRAFLVQPRWVIPREHLQMGAGASLKRHNVVANVRFLDSGFRTGSPAEVEVSEILDSLHWWPPGRTCSPVRSRRGEISGHTLARRTPWGRLPPRTS